MLLLRESLRIHRELGDRLDTAIDLARAARTLAIGGHPNEAAQLLGVLGAIRDELGSRGAACRPWPMWSARPCSASCLPRSSIDVSRKAPACVSTPRWSSLSKRSARARLRSRGWFRSGGSGQGVPVTVMPLVQAAFVPDVSSA